MDNAGAAVVEAAVPANQQTRFHQEGSDLFNRVRIIVNQTTALAGDYTRVVSVSFDHGARPELDAFSEAEKPFVYWELRSLRLRARCKGAFCCASICMLDAPFSPASSPRVMCAECGLPPLGLGGESAVVPLTPADQAYSLTAEAISVHQGVDITPIVDPGCRCLQVSADPEDAPTLRLEVQLRHRNVWPHEVALQDAAGRDVWRGELPRASPYIVGFWQEVTLTMTGRHNRWAIGATAAGRDGPVPPFDDLRLVFVRKALTGTPSAFQLPQVRNVVIMATGSTAAKSAAAYLTVGGAALAQAAGDTMLSPALSADYGDLMAYFAGQPALEQGAYVVVDVTRSDDTAPVLGAVELVDIAGNTARVSMLPSVVRTQSQSLRATVYAPMNASTTDITTGGSAFNWEFVSRVQLYHAGDAAADDAEAAAAGTLTVSRVRIGSPLRWGHVSSPDNFVTDDLACDPVDGWYDAGPFVLDSPVRYGHCRECCCFFDNPADLSSKYCYDQGDVISEVTPAPSLAPNDQCIVCDRTRNRDGMSPLLNPLQPATDVLCDDGEACTWNDRCDATGGCVSEVYATCLIAEFHAGDPSRDCELCDGTGPGSATMGCVAKPGHFVHQPGTAGRACGCLIDGVVYPHMGLHPDLPCMQCDVTVSNTEWTTAPDDTVCDVTQQWDWINVVSQACTYDHTCTAGFCTGSAYSCPPIQACEAPVSGFPHVCDLTGPGSETGGCQRVTLEAGVVCAPQVHGCMPESVCTGTLGTCPPQIELPGIIYEDTGKELGLRLVDGTAADPAYPVVPSVEEVAAAWTNFRVQCGELQLHMAVIPDGACDVRRVSDTVGHGWGNAFSSPLRGSLAALTEPVVVAYAQSTRTVRPVSASDAVQGDAFTLRLDSGAGDFLVDAPKTLGTTGLPSPSLDLEVRRDHGAQLSQAVLVDAQNRSMAFNLPLVQTQGVWTVVSGTPSAAAAASTSGFDWSAVTGLRLVRAGTRVIDSVAEGTALFSVRAVRVRTSAQGPPCPTAFISSADGNATIVDLPAVSDTLFEAPLPTAPLNLLGWYSTATNAFAEDTFLSLEVQAPAAGFAPTEVSLRGADGEGLVAAVASAPVPMADAAGNTTGSNLEWVRVMVSLRTGFLTSGVSDTTFLSTASVGVRFAAGVPTESTARVRRVQLGKGAFCAHASESAINGGLDLFVESSQSAAVVLTTVADSTVLHDSASGLADVGSSGFDVDLSSVYDASCECMPNAVVELDVTLPNPWMSLSRLDVVDASTDDGIHVTLPRAAYNPAAGSANPTGPWRTTISAPLHGDGVTYVGPPASWQSVTSLRFHRTLDADSPAEVLGTITVHAVRVLRTSVPCVTTTTLLAYGFEEPAGAVATADRDIVLGLGDEASGDLVRTDDAAATLSRQAGAWRDGGVGGDDAYIAMTVLDTPLPTGSVAVLAGLSKSTSALRVAGKDLVASSGAPVGIVAGRESRTGRGLWASSLGEGVVPAAAVSTLMPSTPSGLAAIVAGSVTGASAGANVMIGDAVSTSVSSGGMDGFVAVIQVNGSVIGAAVAGSDGDDAWHAAASAMDVFEADNSHAVALGGRSTGVPFVGAFSATDLATTNGSTAVAMVAVYDSAALALRRPGTPRMARIFGHSVDAVDASVVSVALVGDDSCEGDLAVVVAGVYSGGRLQLGDDAELAAPASGASSIFVASVCASSGSFLWMRSYASPSMGGHLLSSMVATQRSVVLCGHTAAASPVAFIASLSRASPATVEWVTEFTGKCHAVAQPSSTAKSLALAGAAAGLVTVTDVAGTRTVQSIPSSYEWQALVASLDARTGAWLSSEVFGSTGGIDDARAVVAEPSGSVMVAGASRGVLAFGHPATARYPAPNADAASATAYFARFFAPSRASAGQGSGSSPYVLYRDGGGASERANGVAAMSLGYLVVGTVSPNAESPATLPVVGGVAVAASDVPATGATFGSVQAVARAGASPTGWTVLGPEWGVTGSSTWADVVATGGASAIAVGSFVTSATSEFITPPTGTDSIARIVYGGTQEPVVAGFNADGGALWAVTGHDAGATPGSDSVVAVDFDRVSATAAVVGSTDDSSLFACSVSPCTAAQVTLLEFSDADAMSAPTATATAFFGGDDVCSEATSVSIGDNRVVVTGTFRDCSNDDSPPFVARVLVLPRLLRPVSSSSGWEYESGDGESLAPPADGATGGWVAVYSIGGELQWSGVTTPTSSDDGAASVSVAGSATTPSSVFVCGNVASTNSSVHLRTAIHSMRPAQDSTLGGSATIDSRGRYFRLAPSGSVAVATAGQSSHVFVASLDANQGSVQWTTWVAVEASGTSCASIIATTDASVLVAGNIADSSARKLLATGAVDVDLDFAGAATGWTLSMAGESGEASSLVALGSGTAHGVALDHIADVALDATGGLAVIATSFVGVGVYSASSDRGAALLAGLGALPEPNSRFTWDLGVLAVPVGSAAGGASASMGVALLSTSPTAEDVVVLDAATGNAQLGSGSGFAVGVGIGAVHSISTGFFKGTLTFGASTETAAGSGDDDSYDALAVVYDASSGHPDGSVAGVVRVTGVGSASDDDKFRSIATSPDGQFHIIVGHATVASLSAIVGVSGVSGGLSATLPGGSGLRDGFAFCFNDNDLSGRWMSAVGALVDADDSLLAAATDGAVAVMGGQITGEPGSYAGQAVYTGSVGTRTLGTVYTAAVIDGTPGWGRAFGTLEDGGSVEVTAVAVDPRGTGVAIAGSFAGGSLVLDSVTLAPAVVSSSGFRTAFVAYVRGSDGGVVWARGAHGINTPNAGSYSVVRGLAVSSHAVIATGEFLHPSGDLSFDAASIDDIDDATVATSVSNGTDVNPHGFAAILDSTDGTSVALSVPTCPQGCRAGGVAVSAGRAYVAYTFQGQADFGGLTAPIVADTATPDAHRGALVVLGGQPGVVDAVQVIGGSGNAHVDAHAVAVGRRGSAVEVAGWRAGGVSLVESPLVPAIPRPDAAFGSLVHFQPLLAAFTGVAMPVLQQSTTNTHTVTATATGVTDAAASNIDEDVSAVGVALGQHTLLTGATMQAATFVSEVASVSAPAATSVGIVFANDRRSGAPLWAWEVAGSSAGGDNTVVATAADPAGGLLCAAGTVSDNDSGSLADLFGAAAPVHGGGDDAFVACFDDVPAAGVEPGTPRWVGVVGASSEQQGTAVAASNGVVWLGFTSRGAVTVAGTELAHSSESALAGNAPRRCAIATLSAHDGTQLAGHVFGGETLVDACQVSHIVASDDGSMVWVAGEFSGASLTVGDGVVLAPTTSSHTTPFVACFSTGGGGMGTFTAVWGVVGTFAPSTFTPGTSFASTAGLHLSAGTTGGDASSSRLFVSGAFTAADLVLATQSSAGTFDSVATVSTAFEVAGATDPSTAFVASIDAATGEVMWVSSVAAVSRAGIQRVGGVALMPRGVLAMPLVVDAGVVPAPGQAALTPASLVAPGSFVFVALVDHHTGGQVGGYTLSDPAPADAASSTVGRAVIASSTGIGSSSPADDVVIGGVARGAVASSLAAIAGRFAPATGVSGGFSFFQVGVGRAARSASVGAALVNTDASPVNLLASRYVVQFDAWRSEGESAIVGGSWQSGDGVGAGVTFTVPAAGQALQAASPRAWLTIEADITSVTTDAGIDTFGARGGTALLKSLRTLTLTSSTDALEDATRWHVRRVRLVPRAEECVPCGQTPVLKRPVMLRRGSTEGDMVPLTVVVDGVDTATTAVNPLPVDASTLVDPTCGCLAGAELRWEESAGSADTVAVTEVSLTDPSGAMGAFSSQITRTEVDAMGWRTASAQITLLDHRRAADMDWRSIARVQFFTDSDADATDLAVRHVTLRRDCALTRVLLHPDPQLGNSSIQVKRTDLGLTRGQAYRVITYETNMWGDDSSPTCTDSFVADDTPPSVASAVVIDVEPVTGAADVDIAYTKHRVLKVGWTGSFSEPDSAPDNILLFSIVNVTTTTPYGGEVPGIESNDRLLPVSATGYVETSELPLEDGERYYVHLGVCNVRRSLCRCVYLNVTERCVLCRAVCRSCLWCCVPQRGKLCTSVLPDEGVVYDASPPTSEAFAIVDQPGAAVAPDVVLPPAFYQTDSSAIHASWVEFSDPHSFVDELRVGLGTADFGTDVHELALVPSNSTSITFGPKAGDDALLEGQAYYVVFAASNPAKASAFYATAPLYIDSSPPEFQWVVDVFPTELAGAQTYYETDDNVGDVDLTDGSAVRAKFKCDDAESVEGGLRGNMTYRWRICDKADCSGVEYQAWTSVGQAERATAPDALIDARNAQTLDLVFVQVECTNPMGLSTVATTNGMRFDATPPNNVSAVIAELDPRPGYSSDVATGDVDWVSTADIVVGWNGFTTDEGRPPLFDFQFGLGTTPGADDVQPFVSVGLASTVRFNASDLELEHGETYYATVVAFTSAGATSSITSDGVTLDLEPPLPVVFDTVPHDLAISDPARCAPHLRCVNVHSHGVDVDYIASTTTLAMSINASIGLAPLERVEIGASLCGDTLFDLNALPLREVPDTETEFSDSTLALFHNQRYCFVVFETTVGGGFGFDSSDGVVVDITPPVPVVVNEGPSADVDNDGGGYLDQLTVTAGCYDPESGVHHMEARISHVDFASGVVLAVVHDWMPMGGSFADPASEGTMAPVTYTFEGLNLVEHDWYVTTVRCINGAGAYVDRDSDGFVVDTTPADADGAVVNHDSYGVTATHSSDATAIEAAWFGFADLESGVLSYSWSIGTSPEATNVLAVTPVGPATIAKATGLSLEDGRTYYVNVYALNAAGLVAVTVSSGVTIDASAPLAPEAVVVAVKDDGTADAGWLGVTSSVSVSWDAADEPHTAVTYRWALGTVPYGQQVVQWTSVGAATSGSASGLGLIPGMAYFVTVETTNEAGLVTVTHSSEIRVDPYAPVAGAVVNGGSVSSPASAQTTTSTLVCSWEAFLEEQSYMNLYRVGFGTTPGAADEVELQTVEAASSDGDYTFEATGLNLRTGTRYYCVVIGYDAAGNPTKRVSAGVMVDTTPPVPGFVWDVSARDFAAGSLDDSDYAVVPTTLYAAWPGWVDADTGIVRMEWAIGHQPGGTSITGRWIHSPTHRTTGVVNVGAPLLAGDVVYVTVRAWNTVGLQSQASSDGLTILAHPNASATLPVTTKLVLIPANGVDPTGELEQGTWCFCGGVDGELAASGAVFDPLTRACSCGPQLYLNPESGLCTPCPAGTCKTGLGNAGALCSAAACSEDEVTPAQPPVSAASLATCGTAGSGKVQRPGDDVCVCPPGTRLNDAGACVSCTHGTVNPFFTDVAECMSCWDTPAPDVLLHVTWDAAGVVPAGVTVTGVVVSVGTSPGALRWVRHLPADATSAVFHSLGSPNSEDCHTAAGCHPPFRQGTHLFTRVRLMVDDAVIEDARGAPLVVDLSAPVPGGVADGPRGDLGDADVVAEPTTLSASWFEFWDSEAGLLVGGDGIHRYDVAFGTSGPGSSDLSNGWVNAGADTSARLPSARIPEGAVVTASVIAYNDVGSWVMASSDGAVMQSKLPAGSVVVVPAELSSGIGGQQSYQHHLVLRNTTAIGAAWQFDISANDEAVVDLRFVWGVIDADSGELLTNMTDVGDASWAVFEELPEALVPGNRYAIKLVASNRAGVEEVLYSPPTLVDVTPPESVSVIPVRGGVAAANGAYLSPADVGMFQTATHELGVQWVCADTEAEVTSVTVAVGSMVGGDQGMARVVLPYDSLSHSFSGLELVHSHCYHVQVQCESEADLPSGYMSSVPVCVDTTAPHAAVALPHPVAVAAQVEAEGLNITTPSGANMTIAEVLRLSSAPVAVELQPFDAHLAAAADHLASVIAGADPAEPTFVSAALHLDALLEVSALDSESTVTYLDLSWSRHQSPNNLGAIEALAVRPWTEVDVDSVDLLGDGSASGGITYNDLALDMVLTSAVSTPMYAHWRVYNGAGGLTHVSLSSPLVLDETPPLDINAEGGTGGVLVAPFQASTTSISASWAYLDDESGMAGYVWSITRTSDGATMVPPTWMGESLSATADDLVLAHGEVYAVSVTACNGAMICRTDTKAVVVDVTGPTGGTLYLGRPQVAKLLELCPESQVDAPLDTFVCDVPAAIPLKDGSLAIAGELSWGGFWDPESPITAFTLALGTSPRGTQLGNPYSAAGTLRSVPLQTLGHTDAAAVSAALYHGATLWASVTAVNQAGLRTTVVAPVLYSDKVPPAPGVVTFDGSFSVQPVLETEEVTADASTVGSVGVPVVVQASTSSLTVSWTAFGNASSTYEFDAITYSVQVVETSSRTVAAAGTVAPGEALQYSWNRLNLKPATPYTAIVTATDYGGNKIAVRSQRQLVVDVTAPMQAGVAAAQGLDEVRDGLDWDRDVDCQSMRGLEVSLSTGVITIDALSGSAVLVENATTVYATSNQSTVVSFAFDPFYDFESGVSDIKVSLGSQAGQANILPWISIPSRTGGVQVLLPTQSEGDIIVASVRATNVVGISADAHSDGLRLLCEPGTVGCDYDGSFLCL